MTEDNKKFNIIVLTLTVAALSLWGAFSQLGEETNGESVAHHCHLFESSLSQTELIATILLIGLVLGFYGVNVDQNTENLTQSQSKMRSNGARVILIVVHGVLAGFIWSMFDTLIDNRTPVCDEFMGRHNMFLCIALIAILVSALYLLSDVAEHFGGEQGKTACNTLVYGIVTFAFFFYATAPPGASAHAFTDSNQQAWTLSATGVVVLAHLAAHYKMLCFKGSTQGHEVEFTDDTITIFKKTQVVVAVVLALNWIFSIVILDDDIKHVAQSTSSTNSSSSCLAEHDNVLGMRLTAVGYWTLYIILVGMALVQTIQRAFETPTHYNVLSKFVISDTKKGWNMPTSIVALTYLWLLWAFIKHGSDFYEAGCTKSHWKEMLIFISHSLGFVVVCVVLPLVYNTKAQRQGEKAGKIDRPNNRFTTKSQVAVDVNTPLNFA